MNCGLTPLGAAALEGDIGTARLLVERGCDVNEPRDSGASPLYGACQEGSVEVAKLLLHARANINQLRTHSGASPLFAGAGHGHGDVVELMLAAGADATIRTLPQPGAKDGFTALSIAREQQGRGSNARKAITLLQAHAAAVASDAPMADAQLPEANVTPAELVGLIRRGQLARLKQLLARPAVREIINLPAGRAGDTVGGVPIGGRTPLVAACSLKSSFSLETVVALLDAGASVDQPAADEERTFPLMAGLPIPSCVKLLLARRANVAQVDAAAYSPLLAACEWGLDEQVGDLLAYGADTHFEGDEAGYTPLVAAATSGRHNCVRLLLEAGVEPHSSLCVQKRSGLKEGLDALGWARYRMSLGSPQAGCNYTEVVRLLSMCDELLAEAIKLGILSEAEFQQLTDELASAPSASRHAMRQAMLGRYVPLVNEAIETHARGEEEAMCALRRDFERAPMPVAVEDLRPKGSAPVYGGRARIHSLTKAAALNGQEGVVCSFNSDGRRRFGLRLKDGKHLGILPANLSPVDRHPAAKRTVTSSEVCTALRDAFSAAGLSSIEVVDWTPLASDPEVDPAHLHEMGLRSYATEGTRAYFVQHTSETERFFLVARELLEAAAPNLPVVSAGGGAQGTLPWLLYGGDAQRSSMVTPPGTEAWCAEPAYVARLCSHFLATDLSCAVCMESMLVREHPSQLPCAHFMCTACLKQLFPIGKMGLDCPVCRRSHPKWALQRFEGSPGGVALAELTR